jgi:hypothetical protein
MLLAIYFIAVLALAVSAYALWSLEEIRKFYEKYYEKSSRTNSHTATKSSRPTPKIKSHWN